MTASVIIAIVCLLLLCIYFFNVGMSLYIVKQDIKKLLCKVFRIIDSKRIDYRIKFLVVLGMVIMLMMQSALWTVIFLLVRVSIYVGTFFLMINVLKYFHNKQF